MQDTWKPGVPLVPVVSAANGVKLVPEVLGKETGKVTVGGQEPFLLSAGEEEVWGELGICGADQSKRIVVPPGLASGWSKNGIVVS